MGHDDEVVVVDDFSVRVIIGNLVCIRYPEVRITDDPNINGNSD